MTNRWLNLVIFCFRQILAPISTSLMQYLYRHFEQLQRNHNQELHKLLWFVELYSHNYLGWIISNVKGFMRFYEAKHDIFTVLDGWNSSVFRKFRFSNVENVVIISLNQFLYLEDLLMQQADWSVKLKIDK